MTITFQDFARVDIRCGTIVKVELFPKAKKPAYKIWADFGDEFGILQTSAQVTVNCQPNDLLGLKIMGVVNLGTKNVAGFISQFLLLGFTDDNKAICLVKVDQKVSNGMKLH